MNAARWNRVKQVFQSALDLPDAERDAFLAAADPTIRAEVADLVRNHRQGDDFLEESVWGACPAEFARLPEAWIGKSIGVYRLVREIGAGGMGMVFLAERSDGEFANRAAIKLIGAAGGTAAVARRFRTERQILARLEHPYVARLLDGGVTESGAPYFVMEYVDGIAIDAFCRERGLSVRERIRLFLKVCEAVQYAHRNLVIHRDLKPGNILVTADGDPKLLDFGIAKVLASETEPDADPTFTSRLMTPEYAPPEQFLNAPLTTASDVYALGVLLFELLTGRRPFLFRDKSLKELAVTVCETPPPSASRVAPDRAAELAGDLDTILNLALRKEPERRYGSVERFADDLRRHLEGRPVLARGDAFSYRISTFVRRNRVAAAGTALAVAALLGGTGVAVWQARSARLAQAQAERRFEDVRQLANNVLFKYHDAVERLPGSTAVREMLLTDALAYLDGLNREAPSDPALMREVATAYQKIGDAQFNRVSHLGNLSAAMESQKKALVIRERLAAERPADPVVPGDLAASHERLSDLYRASADLAAARGEIGRAIEFREAALRADSGNPEGRLLLAKSLIQKGSLLGDDGQANLGDTPGGLAAARSGLSILETLFGEDPASVPVRAALVEGLLIHGNLLFTAGRLEDALTADRRALQIQRELADEAPLDIGRRRGAAAAHTKVADMLLEFEKYAEAGEHQQQAIDIAERIAAADPTDTEARRTLALYVKRQGRLEQYSGRLATAEGAFRRSLTILGPLTRGDAADRTIRLDYGLANADLGDILAVRRREREALEFYEAAAAILDQLARESPTDAEIRSFRATNQYNIGRTWNGLKDHRRALGWFERAVETYLVWTAADPSNAFAQRSLAMTEARLAETRAALADDRRTAPTDRAGHNAAALEWYRRSLGRLRALAEKNALPSYFVGKMAEFEKQLSAREKTGKKRPSAP